MATTIIVREIGDVAAHRKTRQVTGWFIDHITPIPDANGDAIVLNMAIEAVPIQLQHLFTDEDLEKMNDGSALVTAFAVNVDENRDDDSIVKTLIRAAESQYENRTEHLKRRYSLCGKRIEVQ